MRSTWKHVLATLFLFVFVGAMEGAAQQYLVMGTPRVNLRTGPGTDHVVVGKAEKGDIFQVTGEEEGWWQIRMFSGEARYVSKAVRAHPLEVTSLLPAHRMTLPPERIRCRTMHANVLMALDRALREAAELLPDSVAPDHHERLRAVLEDRILLETFHNMGVQPALYGELMAMEWAGPGRPR